MMPEYTEALVDAVLVPLGTLVLFTLLSWSYFRLREEHRVHLRLLAAARSALDALAALQDRDDGSGVTAARHGLAAALEEVDGT